MHDETYRIHANVTILGICVGHYDALLVPGFGLEVDLLEAKGVIKISLENEVDVWLHVEIKVDVDTSFSKDFIGNVKLFSIGLKSGPNTPFT
jgi:hypothetical protein